ncbi:MAG: DUF1178 family protein [Rhodospirillales bacterium]
MIRYQLSCDHDHSFEAWFKDSKAFDRQQAKGVVECPFCGSTDVVKAPMAPFVASTRKGGSRRETVPEVPSEGAARMENAAAEARAGEVAREILQAVDRLRDHVEAHCENVGERFPDEVRSMHYGEKEERPVYGEATLKEARDLLDEGIGVLPLPGRRVKN